MDINNLEAFAPKQKVNPGSPGTKSNSVSKTSLSEPISIDGTLPNTTKIVTNSDGAFFPTEFSCYGSIEITPSSNPAPESPSIIDKPIIDLYILSKNCNEYINLNEEYKQFCNIDKLTNVLEIAKRSYFKSLASSTGNILNISMIEFETPSYIFRDFIWDDYFLDYDTKELILIDKFFTYVKTTDPKVDLSKFIVLKTDKKDPFYNLNYCSLCTFKKICQRSSLV